MCGHGSEALQHNALVVFFELLVSFYLCGGFNLKLVFTELHDFQD
jgi:hypothetical protein